MAKQIAFNEEARRGLERGMNVLADAVKVTLGPRGQQLPTMAYQSLRRSNSMILGRRLVQSSLRKLPRRQMMSQATEQQQQPYWHRLSFVKVFAT
jgi:hypothetical protein